MGEQASQRFEAPRSPWVLYSDTHSIDPTGNGFCAKTGFSTSIDDVPMSLAKAPEFCLPD